jgi:hypothetical protein
VADVDDAPGLRPHLLAVTHEGDLEVVVGEGLGVGDLDDQDDGEAGVGGRERVGVEPVPLAAEHVQLVFGDPSGVSEHGALESHMAHTVR